MENVKVTIDGVELEVPANYTILEAAKQAGIDIPTLCFLKGINEIGACRICVVEVKGARALQASCVTPVSKGMVVTTNSAKVREARKATLELILSDHDRKCLTCSRNGNCELQALAERFNITDIRFEGERTEKAIDDFSEAIVRNPNKCILCRRCVSVCSNVQGVYAIGVNERGYRSIVSPIYGLSLADSPCINCGQCIEACPTGALSEKDHTQRVWSALSDPEKYVVVQTAPAVRVAIGEEFGMPIGTRVTGKMAAALRRLGFDKVFDTDFAADLTIMEEGSELIDRLRNGGKLPMITSCSPGWVKFCETYYPDFLDNLSTCKSPHQMMGAVIKSYYAEKMAIDPKKIYVVSVMPCTAKKYEISRPEMQHDGLRDVDAVITTRELARMIKQANITFENLPDEDFDDPLGESSGAGVIFGATGGVMEAALRTVADIVEGKDLHEIEYTAVRGLEGVREAKVNIGGKELKLAIANGTGNARKLLDKIREGKADYQFIEVMGCPGGCINGGGQPIVSSKNRWEHNVRALRASAIYAEDKDKNIRKSHENPEIKKIYKEYLEKPLGHRSHELLHTSYTKRDVYNVK